MDIPRYARYDLILNSAYQFLSFEGITSFPFDPIFYIKRHEWSIIKYSELMREHRMSLNDVIDEFESEDGFTVYANGHISIAYNDVTKSKTRQRFTLMHEIGHIFLRHFIDFGRKMILRSELTEEEYQVLENECNAFARNTLTPISLIDMLNTKSDAKFENKIMQLFYISLEASKVRISFIKEDRKNYKQIHIQDRLKESVIILNSSAIQYVYNKCIQCKKCNHIEPKTFKGSCIICGNHTYKRVSKRMIYPGIELNSKSRAIICACCENEKILDYGEYCHICGNPVVNMCHNCDRVLVGSARYCPICASPTTFMKAGLLKPWKEHLQKQGSLPNLQNFAINDDDFSKLEDDDNLPF